MKKRFLTSFAAIAASFAAQHATALPAVPTAIAENPHVKESLEKVAHNPVVTVTDSAGEAYEFVLKRSEATGELMAFHGSHSSHSSHSSHRSHYSGR